ncbi:MAG TPA: hypothetical protein VG755_36455 [Nannocystaceae bacterium]|nr:hypothetical protein [Nannocystaceae bacterium]
MKPASTWMLGVFSSAVPDGATSSPFLKRYHVSEEEDPESGDTVRTIQVIAADYGNDELLHARGWERRGRDAIVMNRAADESPVDDDIVEWVITRRDDCGPHVVEAIRASPGPHVTGAWHRGEACVRTADHCNPDCPIEDPYPYEVYWCDRPPEPCGDDSGTAE